MESVLLGKILFFGIIFLILWIILWCVNKMISAPESEHQKWSRKNGIGNVDDN